MSEDSLRLVGEITRLLEETPGGARIMDDIRNGRVSPEEAMKGLMTVAFESGHAETLLAASNRLARLPAELPPVTLQHPNGMTMLNPVMEAAVLERASLDGDVPEMRSGPLPEGATPAVPVLTDALDPVVVGVQLERASQRTAAEISARVEMHALHCEQTLTQVWADASAEGKDVSHALEAAKKTLPPVPTGIDTYRAGEVAPFQPAEKVTVADVATLTPAQRRQYAYRSIATTQGRRSLTRVIESGVVEYLSSHGITVTAGEPDPKNKTLTKWVVEAWGADDLADGFNPITAAIHSMSRDLMEATGHQNLVVQVSPYHGIADRRFGWTVAASPKERTT